MTFESNYKSFTKHEAKILLSIAESLIPPGGPFEKGGKDENLIKEIDSFVYKFDSHYRRGIRLMLWLFELLPIFYKFMPFTMLPLKTREKICEKAESSRFYFRRGTMLIFKLLVMMFFYENKDIERLIGYENHCKAESDDINK